MNALFKLGPNRLATFGLGLLMAAAGLLLIACQTGPAAPPPSTKIENPTHTPESAVADSGKLVLIEESQYPNHKLLLFDLETHTGQTLFEAPLNSWIYQIDLSRDKSQLALAYAAPPTANQVAYDRNGIFVSELTSDGQMSEPQLLFGNTAANEFFFNPIWSADGESLFYVSYKRIPSADGSQPAPEVALMRYDLKSAEHRLIAQDGIWPRVSPQGDQLVFIQVDPETSQRSIRLTDLDGLNSLDLIPFNRFFDIDTPIFSADGEYVYFGAVPHSTTVDRTWWEIALGIQVASAHVDHNIPSDWWRIPADDGRPEKITDVRRIISYGSFDPSGDQLIYTTADGIFSMSTDGDDEQRLPIQNSYRYFVWVP